jgi:hypothetical protein
VVAVSAPAAPEAVAAALIAAGFAEGCDSQDTENCGGRFGFTVTPAMPGPEIIVEVRGTALLPFSAGGVVRALLDDYRAALDAAGYRARTAGSAVVVESRRPTAVCGFCAEAVTLPGGHWTTEDGTTACAAQAECAHCGIPVTVTAAGFWSADGTDDRAAIACDESPDNRHAEQLPDPAEGEGPDLD